MIDGPGRTGLSLGPMTYIRLRQAAPRLAGFDYHLGHWYFVTVVTRGRACILASVENGEVKLSEIGRIVTAQWLERPRWHLGVTLRDFIVMPNHLHAILTLPGNGISLLEVIGGFKAAATRRVTRSGHAQGSLWQRSFFDRIIRDQPELDALRKYIVDNPMPWSLRTVDRADVGGLTPAPTPVG